MTRITHVTETITESRTENSHNKTVDQVGFICVKGRLSNAVALDSPYWWKVIRVYETELDFDF